MLNIEPAQPLARLLRAYAPASEKVVHALVWTLDERLADVLRSVREPAIAAIRLAWWRDALVAGDLAKGRGEPLVDGFRSFGLNDTDRAAIDQLIAGWSALVGETQLSSDVLHQFAEARGGGMATLLSRQAGSALPALQPAGALWALWDLAGHSSNAAEAQLCLGFAQSLVLKARAAPKGPETKVIRLAAAAALGDVTAGRIPNGFAARHYLRIVAASFRV